MVVRRKSDSNKTEAKVKPELAKKPKLDQAEMRRLERLSGEISQARTRMNLQEQVLQNVLLKIENMKLVMKNLENESLLVKERARNEANELGAKAKSLEAFAAELKTKYGLTGEELRYDMLSGELQK